MNGLLLTVKPFIFHQEPSRGREGFIRRWRRDAAPPPSRRLEHICASLNSGPVQRQPFTGSVSLEGQTTRRLMPKILLEGTWQMLGASRDVDTQLLPTLSHRCLVQKPRLGPGAEHPSLSLCACTGGSPPVAEGS